MQSSKILRLKNLQELIQNFQKNNKHQLPKQIKIVEVGPRDGLQNEQTILTPQQKIEFINKLSQTGLKVIEATSFVSKKWVPQMGDAEEVYTGIDKIEGVDYPVLVPNIKGLQSALKVGVKEIAVFGAASEAFSQKNINCSIDESFNRFKDVVTEALKQNIKIRGYVSCVMGCPYEGDIDPLKVNEVVQKLFDLGCYEVSLGDTIGSGTPDKTHMLLEALKHHQKNKLAVHFHDTHDQAIPNILIALQHGISIIDSSVAGLGGCPYAKNATGNVCSENVIYTLHQLGLKTGVDVIKLKEVGNHIAQLLKRENSTLI